MEHKRNNMNSLRNAPFHKFVLVFLLACVLIVSGGEFAFAWVNPVRSPTDAQPGFGPELGPLFGTTQGGSKVGIGQGNPFSKLHLSGGSFLQDAVTSPPTTLKVLESIQFGFDGAPVNVVVVGKYAYVRISSSLPYGNKGLKIYDISGQSLALVSTFTSLATGPRPTPVPMVVAGRYIYTASGGSNEYVSIIDVSDPATPRSISSTIGYCSGSNPSWSGWPVRTLAVVGGYLYVAKEDQGGSGVKLSVLDVSNPADPRCMWSYDRIDYLAGMPVDMSFVSPYLFILGGATQQTYLQPIFVVLDTTNPASPIVLSTANADLPPSIFCRPKQFSISGRYAYVVHGCGGFPVAENFTIYDISNPSPSPNKFTRVGGLSFSTSPPFIYSSPADIFVAGRYAYISFARDFASNKATFRIMDVSNPADPRIVVATEPTNFITGANSAFIAGRRAYLASCSDSSCTTVNGGWLYVVDISGLEASSDATLHSVETGMLQVINDVVVNNNLAVVGEALIGGTAGGAAVLSQLKGDVSVSGDMKIVGNMTKSSGTFEIDHPLDPQNKILRHSFVESPDMKNIYDGVAVLDEHGEAVVELPDYFEALNRDYRYKVTSIGRPAPELYIKDEVRDNRFVIGGGLPGLKVSWQVTGIRKDPFAEAHPIIVEEEKKASDGGTVGAIPFLRFFSGVAKNILLPQ